MVSDSLGLVDFAIGLMNFVNFVLNLPDRQVIFLGEFKLQKNCNQSCSSILFQASWNDFWACTCWVQLAWMASCKTDFLCTLYRLSKKPTDFATCMAVSWPKTLTPLAENHMRSTCGKSKLLTELRMDEQQFFFHSLCTASSLVSELAEVLFRSNASLAFSACLNSFSA